MVEAPTSGCREPDARGPAVERRSAALYAKAGFHEAGVRKNYYTQPVEDALVLVRKIS